MNPNTHVGFLGLGQMGGAIAERLLGKDFQLHVHDPAAQAMERFVAQGAVAHGSPKAVADAAGIVFACLPSQPVSLAAALGSDGVVHGKAIEVYAEMSTIGREVMQAIAGGLEARGIETLDSPVTGGAPLARAGRLTLLVSGPPATVAAARPWLEMMGKDIFVLGDRPGMAQLMKLVNNIVMGANVLAACEGLSLGAKAGLDAGVMLRALSAGSGQSFAAAQFVQRGVAGSFDFGAALRLLDKDMSLGLGEAAALDVTMPVIAEAQAQWHAACEAGLGDRDFTTILQFVEQRSGTLVRERKG
ncbi:MAG: NAD(P)-dependent oxidoreductase [Rubrivivax sp.]